MVEMAGLNEELILNCKKQIIIDVFNDKKCLSCLVRRLKADAELETNRKKKREIEIVAEFAYALMMADKEFPIFKT